MNVLTNKKVEDFFYQRINKTVKDYIVHHVQKLIKSGCMTNRFDFASEVDNVKKLNSANTKKLCSSLVCGCNPAGFVSLGSHLFLPHSYVQDDQGVPKRRCLMATTYSRLLDFTERRIKQSVTNKTSIYSRSFQKLGQTGQEEQK